MGKLIKRTPAVSFATVLESDIAVLHRSLMKKPVFARSYLINLCTGQNAAIICEVFAASHVTDDNGRH